MIRRIEILCLSFLLSANVMTAQAATSPSGGEYNMVDEMGLKTGYWKVTGAIRPTKGYPSNVLIEEGTYRANKKEGVWKKYYPNGEVMSKIEYVKNIPNGRYKTYFPTGQIEEEGNWTNSRNTGTFKRFHPNGQVSQEFIFADNGRRSGAQKYYHENGQVELEVTVINGQEEGQLKRYYANGDLKETKTFNAGKVDPGSIRMHTPKKPEVKIEEAPAVVEKTTTIVKEDKPNVALFNATGNNTLYNKDRQISQTGYFKNGRLHNGKWYRYTEDGLLEAIEIYKKGKFIGNAVMEELD